MTAADHLVLDDPHFGPGTVAVVTGAASGIGQATSVALVANGLSVVGTVDINAGVFETFTNEDVTPDAVLVSAAVPTLFEAVEIHGHYHWDGLFSQNPPIDDLMTGDAARKPDELWVIQINPKDVKANLPRSKR